MSGGEAYRWAKCPSSEVVAAGRACDSGRLKPTREVALRPKLILSTAAAFAAAAIVPATAAALSTANPPSVNFGDQAVGTTSGPQPVTLSVGCTVPMVIGVPPAPPIFICTSLVNDIHNVSIGTSGDFAATSNCPASLAPGVTATAVICTIDVTFTPTATGARAGTLSTGTVGVGGLLPGPTVALSGTGVAAANGDSGGSAGAVGGKAKKCKKKGKKRAAWAAGKTRCKKKKGGK